MENLNLIKPEKVQNIINKFCYTIGMIPTSYKVSLTYEEQIIAIGHYLEETVIPALNNNAEAVAELQTLFVQLKDYVENYFDNLDVQNEINNKLDKMIQDGTLQEIITNYLNSKAMFVFNNVNEMLNSTNLIDGSYAKTLGFYELNDGGNAIYKIVNKNQLIVDNMSILQMNNQNLVATLIYEDSINIKQLGAKGDNNFDNTNIINKALELSNYIFIPKGTYLTGEINISSNKVIKGENIESSILSKKSNANYVLGMPNFQDLYDLYTNTGNNVPDDIGLFNINLSNFTIDGNNTTGYGIKLFGRYFNWNNLIIKNIDGTGIWTAFGQHKDPETSNSTQDLLESKFEFIKILNITGNGWNFNGPHDSYVNHCIFVKIDGWAFYENTPHSLGGGWITNCNCWEVGNGFYIKSGGRITQCAFTGYDNSTVGHDTYGLYFDDTIGSVCAIGCIFGGMDYGISIAGSNNYITGQFYRNRKANLDIRSGAGNVIEGIFTPFTTGKVISETSKIGAITLLGSVIGNLSSSELGASIVSANVMLRTTTGQIVNFPNKDAGFTFGGWSPKFPGSNGTLITDNMQPTSSSRGGVLRQTLENFPAGETATTDQLNSMLAVLRTAGVLNL